MMQIMRTTQLLPKETVTLERVDGHDGQGLTTYESAVTFEANIVEYDTAALAGEAGSQFVTNADGSMIRTPLSLYVQGDELEVPNEEDRVTVDSKAYIVKERKLVHGLLYTRAEPDHYRLRCAVE
jgi:hypothetical protein